MAMNRNLLIATEEVLEDLKKQVEFLKDKEICISAAMAQCVTTFASESVNGKNSQESIDTYNSLMTVFKENYASCQVLLDVVKALIEQKGISDQQQQQILIKDPLFFYLKEDTKQFIESYFVYENASTFFAKAPEGNVSHLYKESRISGIMSESRCESPLWEPSGSIRVSNRVWGKKANQIGNPNSNDEDNLDAKNITKR